MPNPRAPRPYAALGRRLRELRTQARLTQEQLAKEATSRSHPITHSAPSQWEKGEIRPTLPRLEAVIRVLQGYGVPVDRDELLHLARYPGYQPLPADVIPVDDPAKLIDGRHLLRLPAAALAWLRNFADFMHLEAVDESGAGLPGAGLPFGVGSSRDAAALSTSGAAMAGDLSEPGPQVGEAGADLMGEHAGEEEHAIAHEHGV